MIYRKIEFEAFPFHYDLQFDMTIILEHELFHIF